ASGDDRPQSSPPPSSSANAVAGPGVYLDRPQRTSGPARLYAETMAPQAVELHVVSDSTGETATRLVHALEAQFPEQQFEEIRHSRVETVDDLQLALNRAKGRPAVIIYTLVHPELREAAPAPCRQYRRRSCDL